jgi:phage shock protein E
MTRTSFTGGLVLGAVLLTAAACSSASSPTPPPPDAAAAATATVADGRDLTPGDFAARAAQPGVVLIDVRTDAEFAEGHIPGALHLDATAPDGVERLAALDPDVDYAIYCRSGNRSLRAMEVMAAAGITDVVHLAGGVVGWVDSGRALTTPGAG